MILNVTKLTNAGYIVDIGLDVDGQKEIRISPQKWDRDFAEQVEKLLKTRDIPTKYIESIIGDIVEEVNNLEILEICK